MFWLKLISKCHYTCYAVCSNPNVLGFHERDHVGIQGRHAREGLEFHGLSLKWKNRAITVLSRLTFSQWPSAIPTALFSMNTAKFSFMYVHVLLVKDSKIDWAQICCQFLAFEGKSLHCVIIGVWHQKSGGQDRDQMTGLKWSLKTEERIGEWKTLLILDTGASKG